MALGIAAFLDAPLDAERVALAFDGFGFGVDLDPHLVEAAEDLVLGEVLAPERFGDEHAFRVAGVDDARPCEDERFHLDPVEVVVAGRHRPPGEGERVRARAADIARGARLAPEVELEVGPVRHRHHPVEQDLERERCALAVGLHLVDLVPPQPEDIARELRLGVAVVHCGSRRRWRSEVDAHHHWPSHHRQAGERRRGVARRVLHRVRRRRRVGQRHRRALGRRRREGQCHRAAGDVDRGRMALRRTRRQGVGSRGRLRGRIERLVVEQLQHRLPHARRLHTRRGGVHPVLALCVPFRVPERRVLLGIGVGRGQPDSPAVECKRVRTPRDAVGIDLARLHGVAEHQFGRVRAARIRRLALRLAQRERERRRAGHRHRSGERRGELDGLAPEIGRARGRRRAHRHRRHRQGLVVVDDDLGRASPRAAQVPEPGGALEPERGLIVLAGNLQAEPLVALEDAVVHRPDRCRNRRGEHGAVARPVARAHRQLAGNRRVVVAGHRAMVRGEHRDGVRRPRLRHARRRLQRQRGRRVFALGHRVGVLRPLRDDRRVHHHHLHRRRVGRRRRRHVAAPAARDRGGQGAGREGVVGGNGERPGCRGLARRNRDGLRGAGEIHVILAGTTG